MSNFSELQQYQEQAPAAAEDSASRAAAAVEAIAREKLARLKKQEAALYSCFAALFFSCLLMMGGTYAWYTATTASAVNRIQSGNLTVGVASTQAEGRSAELQFYTPKTGEDGNFIFTAGEGGTLADAPVWCPNQSYLLEPIHATNAGTVDFSFTLVLRFTAPLDRYIENPDVTEVEKAAKAQKDLSLLKVLTFEVLDEAGNPITDENGTAIKVCLTENEWNARLKEVRDESGTLTGYTVNIPLYHEILLATTTNEATQGKTLVIRVTMNDTNNSAYENLYIPQVEAVINAKQYMEGVSGTQSADEELYTVKTAGELAAALNNANGETIYLQNDIDLGEAYLNIPGGMNTTLNLGGCTLSGNLALLENHGTLTITGTGQMKSAKILATNLGTLTIEGAVSLTAAEYALDNRGLLTVKEGVSVQSTGGAAIWQRGEGDSQTILTGGSFCGTPSALSVTGGTILTSFDPAELTGNPIAHQPAEGVSNEYWSITKTEPAPADTPADGQ